MYIVYLKYLGVLMEPALCPFERNILLTINKAQNNSEMH